MSERHIIAIGGGGFSAASVDSLLDSYVLAQAATHIPRVCFLATASGDDPEYISRFYWAMARLHCRPSHLSLSNPPTSDFESFLLAKDVIYVGAGNTKHLLDLWRDLGIGRILHRAWELGVVLAGTSAGAVCWFDQCLSDYISGEFNPLNCIGILSGSLCPHYDSQPGRSPIYRQLIGSGRLPDGVAVDDDVALHYKGLSLARVVNSRRAARAVRVMRDGAGVTEVEIRGVYLGDEAPIPARE